MAVLTIVARTGSHQSPGHPPAYLANRTMPTSVERVYLLGAGSSASAGAPLIKDFKERAEEIVLRDGSRVNPLMGDAIASWNTTASAANVEEYYVLVDLLARLNGSGQSQRAVEGVRYLIAKTLELSMVGGISEIHKKFVHKVWDISQGRRDFAIITLNWDIAVDNAAYTHSQFSLDYGYEKARSFHGDPDRGRPKLFSVLKLHGSLNWWVCQNEECQTLWYTEGEKDVPLYWEKEETRLCRTCGSILQPLMVPPTAQKFESSQKALSPMRSIWKETREAMVNCRDLAIIGYSFPPTDVQFRFFLLEALSNNHNLRKILVISSPKIGSRRLEFEDSYDTAFVQSPHRQKLDFAYDGFEAWVESGMPF